MPDKQLVATIVAAYTKSTTLQVDQLLALIAAVHATLLGIETGGRSEPPKQLMPAVPVRRSITPSKVICLDCGYEGKMLKRHLNTAHGLTPDAYRERWKLKPDYPVVAPDYAARRGELARSYGFGKHRSTGRRAP
jgi:predicted transcriptional regulator